MKIPVSRMNATTIASPIQTLNQLSVKNNFSPPQYNVLYNNTIFFEDSILNVAVQIAEGRDIIYKWADNCKGCYQKGHTLNNCR